MPKLIRVFAYPLVGAVSFALFFVLLFPYNSVKVRAASEIEKALGGGYTITIGGLSPSPPSGVVLSDVEIKPLGGGVHSIIPLKRAKLRFALLPLLSGAVEVKFDLSPQQGRAQGSFSVRRESVKLDAEMKAFDLALAALLLQHGDIPLSGSMDGNIHLEIYPPDPLRNRGTISIDLPEALLG